MFSEQQINRFFGVLIGLAMLFGLAWLMLYLNKRGIKTHPSEKRARRYQERGRAKAEKKRDKRRLRY